MMPAKASLREAADRLAALGYTNVRQLDGGLQGWTDGGLRTVPGRQFLRQGLWRTGGVAAAHAFAGCGGGRGADRRRRQHQNPRCPALRRIRHHEHPRLRQRARRGTGAARRPRRAGSRDHHHRQLRRPHPLDHRHPVADQCRRRQQGAGAAQRDDRLDAGQTKSRARLRPARRDRRRSRARKPMRATSPIAPASGIIGIGRDDGAAGAG